MPSFNQLLARLSDMFGNSSAPSAAAIPFANRNMFVDGAFDAFTASTVALSTSPVTSCATMWYGSAGLGGAGSHSQSATRANPGAMSASDSNPYNVLAHVQTTGSTGTWAALNLPSIGQKIEGVQRLAGKSITLSCKLFTNTPFTMAGVYCNQNFGTGGSPTAGVSQAKAVNWSVTGTMRRFSVRIDVAQLPASPTFGTNNNDFTNVGIFLPAGWTGTLYSTEWQVEYSNPASSGDLNGFGGAPTAFEYRGIQAELARVQRHYWNSYPTGVFPGTATGSPLLNRLTSTGSSGDSFPVVAQLSHPQLMRAAPAMTSYSNNSGASGKVYAAADVPGFFGVVTALGFTLQVNNSPITAGSNLSAHVVADARL